MVRSTEQLNVSRAPSGKEGKSVGKGNSGSSSKGTTCTEKEQKGAIPSKVKKL